MPESPDNPFEHGTATVNGVALHYVRAGQGPAVVLLHGWPQTWYAWRHVMPALAAHYTVIAPDMRGLGDSARPAAGYDKKTIAEDIYQLVRQLGFTSAALVGHDYGGPVAYAYAAAHPAEVRQLVILEVGPIGKGFEKIPLVARDGSSSFLWHFAFHLVPELPELLVAGHEREYLAWWYKSAHRPGVITDEDLTEYARTYAAPGAMHAGFEYYRTLFADIDAAEADFQTKLPMPVLVLGGEHSFGTTPLEQMRPICADIRGGVVPDCGHWIPEEQPAYLTQQLLAFLKA